ncbi:hydroxyacid dehydrogenase [Paraburkholderia aspalathi]|jgi:D-3-phosphoglycerate dehydrogenase|uniref:D-3-phosphoglycerate dehydrogenase n=1 Tax=Paraburkholderia aspalathi TaxID=1324617 RepID=A0A1I7DBR9_9BURK|nr:hydroxyacid dehydrogenase [Paraburkholderia aspalathi]SFU09173.1 D-3-phosphoglycerate dehydrogenase [Paraburkholderia aspalathi]
MTTGHWNIVRFDLPLDSSFDRLLDEAPSVRVRICDPHGDERTTQAVLSALSIAHGYHVSSAKDELPARWFVTEALLERCPQLLWVTTYGAGYDTVDVNACTRAGVCVVNQAGSNAVAVAEHTFGCLLALTRRIVECNQQLRLGGHFSRHDFIGRDLSGLTLGIVGIGHVGKRVAALARAFGMNVIAADPLVDEATIRARGAKPASLETLLGLADVVSLHCPLNAGTAGLIDRAAFERMKPGSLFISTARGGVHDEAALYDALQQGHLAGAALDVWSSEPPAPDHPLLSLSNVVATYHIAGVTTGARQAMASTAAGQIVQLTQAEPPANLVNREVWPACARRIDLARQSLGRA